MSIPIDLKDRRILRELDLNARQTNSAIAKRIGLSPEVVNYRIKRLEDENIITHYTLITDISVLGILQFKLCIKTQHLPPIKLEEILSQVSYLDEAKWVGTVSGSFDVVVSCEVHSILELDEVKNSVLSMFGSFVSKVQTSILVEAQIYPRDYLVDHKRTIKSERTIMQHKSLIDIDNVDLSIMRELAKNVRANVLDIASNLELTPRVVTYRIKQLEKQNVIQGYKIAIDYSKLKIHYAKLFIYLDNPENNKVKKLIQFLKNHSSCIIYVKTFGEWDLEPEFEFSSVDDFDSLLNQLKTDFADLIKTIDVVSVKKEYKYTYF